MDTQPTTPATPGKKLILFAHARSGSNNLAQVLSLHPDWNTIEEPFNTLFSTWHPGQPNYVDRITDNESLERVLDELFSRYSGIKVLDFHLPKPLYTHMLSLPGYKVIFLRRRNILQAIVSGLIAEQTYIWHHSHSTPDREAVYQNLQPISLQQLGERFNLQKELQSYYGDLCSARSPASTLLVDHEDLYLSGPEGNRLTVENIFAFLGTSVPASQELDRYLNPAIAKINNRARYSLVPNANEIEQLFGDDSTGHLFD